MALSMFSPKELKAITDLFDLNVELNPDDFVGFGLKNSRVYFAKLARIMGEIELDERGKIHGLRHGHGHKEQREDPLEAMKAFERNAWYASVQQFFVAKTCQYTGEEGVHTIAVIHIPSSMPTITARIWCMITPVVNRTVNNFLSNLWAAQLDLDADLMVKQMTWEVKFWNDMVKKGGKNYKEGFHQDFWDTKACDSYPLTKKNGQAVKKEGLKYSEKELEVYLESFALVQAV